MYLHAKHFLAHLLLFILKKPTHTVRLRRIITSQNKLNKHTHLMHDIVANLLGRNHRPIQLCPDIL